MKPPQSLAVTLLAVLSLVLALYLALVVGSQTKDMQKQSQTMREQVDTKQEHLMQQQGQLQAQQEEINKGATSQQIGVNLLKVLAEASLKDPALKDVLTKNGYAVNANPSPAPSASPASTR